jgi:ribonuclease G
MKSPQHRKQVETTMERALAADPTTTSYTGLSKFGLLEITRKRVRPELQEFYTDVCHACSGLGWVFSPETVTARMDRDLRRMRRKDEVKVAVHPAVSAYLLQDQGKMKKLLEQEHQCSITLISDEELDQDEYNFLDEHGNAVERK